MLTTPPKYLNHVINILSTRTGGPFGSFGVFGPLLIMIKFYFELEFSLLGGLMDALYMVYIISIDIIHQLILQYDIFIIMAIIL